MTGSSAPHVTLLRRVLFANAIVSSLCAVIFLAASGVLADLVGAAREEILATGVSLVVFVAMILTVLMRRDILKRWVLALATVIAVLDVLWVLSTPLKIAAYSVAGQWIFGFIAVVVAVFAVLEIRALYGIFAELRRAGTAPRWV